MSEKEMNSYRFVSGQEPSDEMLSQLMCEVAEEAVERRKRADDEYFSQMRRNVAAKKERWAEGTIYINPDEVAKERFGDWNSREAILSAANYCAEWAQIILPE